MKLTPNNLWPKTFNIDAFYTWEKTIGENFSRKIIILVTTKVWNECADIIDSIKVSERDHALSLIDNENLS